MAKHQIIYTSCMRGIDGVNDGQQVYSYDERFSDCKNESVKSLFTYQVPNLRPGVIMNEKIALTMPISFSYRLLNTGSAAVSLNTYLGRDYMGSAGRFGNHLCHAIVTDFNDMTIYPCELYDGPSLRKSMKYEEVNNPKAPEYLEEPVLTTGPTVSPDTIIDFLEIGDNLDYYKQMIVAMLRYPTEKKRVVICDEQENIIKWIAAMHYALPLDIAKTVNFTTYEFDPELSASQICGVIQEGSRYNVESYISAGKHYVFDFIKHRFSKVEGDNSYLDFLDTAFSFSYDSLQQFHEFINIQTTFREASEELYSGYDLFSLLKDGISEVNISQFKHVIEFAEGYTTDKLRLKIVSKIIEEKDMLDQIDNEYVLVVFRYLLKNYAILNRNQENDVKEIIVDRIINVVSDATISEDDFIALYDDIDKIARNINLSMPSELMNDEIRPRLLKVIEKGFTLWKVYFIIRVISDYVKDIELSLEELYFNRPIGQLYVGVLELVYSKEENKGFDLVKYILDNFKSNSSYLINMTLSIENFLEYRVLKSADTEKMWNYFDLLVVSMDETEIFEINKSFEKYERFDEMYRLYKTRINNTQDLEQVQLLFNKTFNYWSEQKQESGIEYAKKVLKLYEEVYRKRNSTLKNEESFSYAKEILQCAMKLKVREEYVESIIDAVLKYIPIEKTNKEKEKFLMEMQQYQVDVLNRKLSGRLLLLYIGMQFERITKISEIETLIKRVNYFSESMGAQVSELDKEKTEIYFKWILKYPLEYSLVKTDLSNIYNLFVMTRRATRYFMEHCCSNIYKKCKSKKNYSEFAEFLKFMFEYGSSEDIENVGKYLCKLNKQKLEDLDKELLIELKKDRKSISKWKEIKDIAQKTNPLLKNLSGLFRRKNLK